VRHLRAQTILINLPQSGEIFMSTPPVSANPPSSVPIFSITIPTATVATATVATDTKQESESDHPPTSTPPQMTINELEQQPEWLNEWRSHIPTEVASNSSSSSSSSQTTSSDITLIQRQTTSSVVQESFLESLPPEALCNIFTQLQQPRLFNTSLSNVAKTSKTMYETALSFIHRDSNGRTYKLIHTWSDNIQSIREYCSESNFRLSSKFILRLANQEKIASNAEADIYKLKSICFDFSAGKHLDFQIKILSQMCGAFIKIDASAIGMEVLQTRVFPALANSADSNILILDLSSNALSAGNATELFKLLDKKNNFYRINLSDNPNFSDNPQETKDFYNLMFGKIRPLYHLRMKNTGFNDVCVQSICDSLNHPHLMQAIDLDQHNASNTHIDMLKKSLQKHTAELSYFISSTRSIYSIPADGILADNIDIDWNSLKREYDELQQEYYSTSQVSMYSEVTRKLRNHPITKLHERSIQENDSDSDNNDFEDVLPVD
jgi:hypothetical protein